MVNKKEDHLSKIHDLADSANRLLSPDELDQSIERMAHLMNDDLADANPIFLCVLLGGLIPFAKLVMHLKMPLVFDYIHVTRYQGKTIGDSELAWIAKPVHDMSGRTVVIVDDILDKGLTIEAIKQYCFQQGASRVLSSVLLDKKVPRAPGGLVSADYSAISINDEFVFGYGLDYENYLRNLPGIYTM